MYLKGCYLLERDVDKMIRDFTPKRRIRCTSKMALMTEEDPQLLSWIEANIRRNLTEFEESKSGTTAIDEFNRNMTIFYCLFLDEAFVELESTIDCRWQECVHASLRRIGYR